MLRAPKNPSDTAYSTSMIMYGSSPIHISSCLRGIPTHEDSVNLSRDPSSLRTTMVMRSVAVIGESTLASLEPEHIEHVVPTRGLGGDPGGGAQGTDGEDGPRGGAVADLQSLAGAEEVRRMLADDIATADRRHADLAARSGPDVAIARVAFDLVVIDAVAGRDRTGDHQGGARGGVPLGAVMGLDDLGVPLRAERAGGLANQAAPEGDSSEERRGW